MVLYKKETDGGYHPPVREGDARPSMRELSTISSPWSACDPKKDGKYN
jgi:hypothetical protein